MEYVFYNHLSLSYRYVVDALEGCLLVVILRSPEEEVPTEEVEVYLIRGGVIVQELPKRNTLPTLITQGMV